MKILKAGFPFILAGLIMLAGAYAYQKIRPKLPQKLVIKTASLGGVYHQIAGNGLKPFFVQRGVEVVVESTNGSLENLEDLEKGEADLVFFQSGSGGESQHARVVSALFTEYTLFIVPKNSKIQSVKDLRGKQVDVGALGSGSEIISWLILEHNGITRDDITPHFLRFPEMVEAFEQNRIDAAFATEGVNSAIIRKLLLTGDCRLLPVEGAKAIQVQNLAVVPTTLAAGMFGNNTIPPADLPTLGVKALLLYRDDAPLALVFALDDLIFNSDFARDLGLHELIENEDFATHNVEFPLHPWTPQHWKRIPIGTFSAIAETAGFFVFMATLVGSFLVVRFRVLKHTWQRQKDHLDEYFDKVMQIEREQKEVEDPKILRQFLRRVTECKHEVLRQYTAEQFQGDFGLMVFILECYSVATKLQLKMLLYQDQEVSPPA
ncbi:MAG: TAXI family TRAP transporter solute-binding subunit [bacterium]